MKIFEDTQDVRDWLAPMDYETFWREIEPYALDLDPRWHCDAQIASGEVSADVVLRGLKAWAWAELYQMFNLPPRVYDPPPHSTELH